MVLVVLINCFLNSVHLLGNFALYAVLVALLVITFCGKTLSLLRSRLGCLAFDVIPGRFSSSLPSLFASGRFATFLSSASR